MAKDYLPNKIDPFRAAAQGIRLDGHLLIKNMARLTPDLSSNEGEVGVKMEFGIDEQDVCIVKGQIDANLILQCQRCMEPLSYEIITDFVSGIVHSEQEGAHLPEQYTVVVATDGMFTPQELIEDELIVNLPIVSMHDPEVCKVKLPFKAGSEDAKDNPFNVISILRSKTESKKE